MSEPSERVRSLLRSRVVVTWRRCIRQSEGDRRDLSSGGKAPTVDVLKTDPWRLA